jgi:hypothetical protein
MEYNFTTDDGAVIAVIVVGLRNACDWARGKPPSMTFAKFLWRRAYVKAEHSKSNLFKALKQTSMGVDMEDNERMQSQQE